MVPAVTKRPPELKRKRKLDELIADLYTADVFQLKAVKLRPRPNETDYPEGYMFWAASQNEQDRILDYFEIEGDRLPMTFPTAGFTPKDGKIYPCKLRQCRSGIMLAFPANRFALRESGEFAPNYFIVQGTFPLDVSERGISGRHPLTGQRVIPFKDMPLPDPDKEGKIAVPMTGKALRPLLFAGVFILGDQSTLDTQKAHDLVAYDDAYAAEQQIKMEKANTYNVADTFPFFGESLTAFEIFGGPQAAKSVKEMEDYGKNWFEMIEGWSRRTLPAAIHSDSFPELTTDQRKRAIEIYQDTIAGTANALDWARKWLKKSLSKVYAKVNAGLSAGTYKVPKPKNREPYSMRVLATYEKDELHELFTKILKGGKLTDTIVQPSVKKSPEKPAASAAPQTTASKPQTTTATKVAQAIKPVKPQDKVGAKGSQKLGRASGGRTRTVAQSGDDDGGNSIAAVLASKNPELVKKLEEVANGHKETSDQPGKPEKSFRMFSCNSCGGTHRAYAPEYKKVCPKTKKS